MTSFNPILTTSAAGTFGTQSDGYVQGVALDDPATRFALAQGIVAAASTDIFFGGMGISENVPPGESASIPLTGFDTSLGGVLTRARNVTGGATAYSLTGFSVFNQAHAGIQTPQSPVPLYNPGMSLNFYRLGSGARLAVRCDAALAAALENGTITQPVSWDYVAQELVPYVAAYPANVLTGATWAATAGGEVTFTTTSSHGVAVGDVFEISGCTPSGYNGTYTAIAGTTGSTLVAAKTSDPGAISVEGTLVAGGGAVNVRILDVNIGNSMTVSVDPATGFATWNRSGTTANILI